MPSIGVASHVSWYTPTSMHPVDLPSLEPGKAATPDAPGNSREQL